MHCTHFRLWGKSRIPDYLKEKITEKISDTSGLWGYAGSTPIRLRDIGDACRIVAARRDEINAETAAKNEAARVAEQHAVDAAAAKAAEILGGPVTQVVARYFDGYPSTLTANGTEISLRDNWGKVAEVDNHVFMLIADADAAITAAEEKAAAAEAEKQAKADNEVARRAELIEVAKATGEKQVLRKYTSTYCHDNLPDCSFDNVTIWIDAAGQTSETYTHCF